ncbi:peptide-binding protein [Clostridia bacterium]|nr:peptide-binding protein [Clostridia bacterium]
MKLCRVVAIALALMMLCTSALADGPLSMTLSKSVAQTLENLPEKAKTRTDTIVIGTTDLYGEVNPLYARTRGDTYAVQLMYDEWIFLDEYGMPGSGMCDYTVSPDGLTYTFTLKPARYSDGALVSAMDCLNTLYIISMPGYDGNRDVSTLAVEGLDYYLQGVADMVSGFRLLSDNSFAVILTRPNASAAALLTLPAMRVAHYGSAIRPEGMGASAEASKAWYAQRLDEIRTSDASLAGYGQYDLVQMEAGQQARFAANDDYWRAKPSTPYIDLLVVPVGQEYDALMDGDVDIAYCYADFAQLDRLYMEGKGFVSMYEYVGDVFGYLGMRTRDGVFSDERVRQAFAYGLRRKSAVDATLERFATVPGMILFDTFGAASDVLGELYPYDSEKAAALMDDADWIKNENGIREKDGKPFEFTLAIAEENPVAGALINEFELMCTFMGFTMHVERVPLMTLIERVAADECEMYLMAQQLPTNPAAAAGLFGGSSPQNVSGYDSDGLERFFMWAALESTPERQTMVYEGLYQQFYLELPMIPLYRRKDYLMVSARVRNLYVSTGHDITAEAYRMIIITQLE